MAAAFPEDKKLLVGVKDNCGAGDERLSQDLAEILTPLSELCIYELVDQARKGLYGDDYGVWPEQWPSRGEELLALDRAAHVPNNSPQTQQVADIIYSFVHRLAEELSTETFTTHEEVTIGPFQIGVQPIGSFPINCKVKDMDELDYLLLVRLHDQFKTMLGKGQMVECFIAGTSTEIRADNFEMYQKLKSYLSPAMERVVVSAIYEHGPAVCVELSWECNYHHNHTLSVDMTLGIELTTFTQAQYLETSFNNVEQAPFNERARPPFTKLLDLVKQGDRSWAIAEGSIWSLTSGMYDRQLMSIVADVSENILPAYCLLKVLCDQLLPQKVRKSKPNGHHRKPYYLDLDKVDAYLT